MTTPQQHTGQTDGGVSVVIPTWNRWPRVRDAVASVLRQTSPPLEVLVVDDGSDDGTAEALEAENWSDAERRRLRILSTPHAGVSAARNVGIAESRGRWLAFLDSDDTWQEHKLARQLQALEDAEHTYWVCHTDELWIRNGRRVNPRRRHAKRGGWIYQHCLPLCAISPSAVMMHRRVFEAVGTFDPSFPACEDYDLWLRVTAEFPVLFVDEPLVVKHGGHDDQLSRRVPALDRYRIRALGKSLDNPAVTGEDRRMARQTLLQKIKIYGAGARKRGRHDEADALAALEARYLEEDREHVDA